MRVIALLFDIYFMALAVVPCSDAMHLSEEKISHIDMSDHHEHEDDFCSPFCLCNCCGSVMSCFEVNLTKYIQAPAEEYFVVQKIFAKEESFKSDYHGSIWQPPKV